MKFLNSYILTFIFSISAFAESPVNYFDLSYGTRTGTLKHSYENKKNASANYENLYNLAGSEVGVRIGNRFGQLALGMGLRGGSLQIKQENVQGTDIIPEEFVTTSEFLVFGQYYLGTFALSLGYITEATYSNAKDTFSLSGGSGFSFGLSWRIVRYLGVYTEFRTPLFSKKTVASVETSYPNSTTSMSYPSVSDTAIGIFIPFDL